MNLNEASQLGLTALAEKNLKRSLPQHGGQAHLLDLSSNDYLCLSQHPEVVQAGIECALQFGAGATGSRLLSGNLGCFEALENQVAQFKNMPAALVFSSGYQANSSGLAALLGKALWGVEPVVFTDRLNHASLHHACQLAGVRQIRFRHNDMLHLRECLQKTESRQAPRIIVTETVFGMDGDVLPIVELAQLAHEFNATVYLDEAHATGLWGPQGRGLGSLVGSPAIDQLKAQGQWVVMGTFSKAVGVSGAYIACSAVFKDYLLNRCTGFVYSTAPSPFVVGAVQKALKLIPALEKERLALHSQSAHFRSMVQGMGFDTGASSTQIVPLVLGQVSHTLSLKEHLQEQAIVVSAIRPPTVAHNTSRIRLTFNTSHNLQTLERIAQALGTWRKNKT